ncbi:MAG: hypothetical protein IPL61_27085 [Myxococcales bacterium]|nr:hypothetical protein [Myxococcales bacterium]
MRACLVLGLILSAACGGPRSTSPAGDPGDPVAPPDEPGDPVAPGAGGEGTICRIGEGHPQGDQATATPCADGLQCCYPCGIPGCDSVCMTDCGPPRP